MKIATITISTIAIVFLTVIIVYRAVISLKIKSGRFISQCGFILLQSDIEAYGCSGFALIITVAILILNILDNYLWLQIISLISVLIICLACAVLCFFKLEVYCDKLIVRRFMRKPLELSFDEISSVRHIEQSKGDLLIIYGRGDRRLFSFNAQNNRVNLLLKELENHKIQINKTWYG